MYQLLTKIPPDTDLTLICFSVDWAHYSPHDELPLYWLKAKNLLLISLINNKF